MYDTERFKNRWVATLRELRQELGFAKGAYIPAKNVGTYAPPAEVRAILLERR